MKVYGLIGNPLSHSFSKKYFTDKFSAEKIVGCQYLNFEIKDLATQVLILKSHLSLKGLNVTIPYKSAIIPCLDQVSAACEVVQACNCIKITAGKWEGFNTDIIGFERSFVPLLQPRHRKALILGTGGAAKAVAYVLQHLTIDFLYVSRQKNPAGNTINYAEVSAQLIRDYNIVINTTPAGMFPNIGTFPQLPYDSLSQENYCFDLVYNPAMTVFLSKSAAQGALTKNGGDMLAIQAEESWKIWTQS